MIKLSGFFSSLIKILMDREHNKKIGSASCSRLHMHQGITSIYYLLHANWRIITPLSEITQRNGNDLITKKKNNTCKYQHCPVLSTPHLLFLTSLPFASFPISSLPVPSSVCVPITLSLPVSSLSTNSCSFHPFTWFSSLVFLTSLLFASFPIPSLPVPSNVCLCPSLLLH